MRASHIINTLGIVTVFIALAMLPSTFVAFLNEEPSKYLWLLTFFILATGGGLLYKFCSVKEEISYREGFAVVTLTWFTVGIWGGIPYLFTGVFDSFIFSFFESASGFTTTGATAIVDIEVLPRSILLWRSLTHWLGGMGVVVLSVCILPLLGVGGTQLFHAEAPGPLKDKLTPRIASTAKILWKIYFFFTLIYIVLIYFCGMNFFDAVCHGFSTLATGGFSTKNASLIAYNSLPIEIITIAFMFLAGISFSLYYRLIRGDFRSFFKNSELIFYCFILIISMALIFLNVYKNVYDSLGEALRFVVFQVISLSTSTGFVTADFNEWPPFSQLILLFLMFMGACAGSTGGGLKVIRVILVLKYALRELRCLLYPGAMFQIKLRKNPVSKNIVQGVLSIFVLSIFLIFIASLFMAFLGLDIVTSVTSVLACFFNIGPGLAKVGAVENYAHIPTLGKLILSVCMIMGRLEIFTVIIFLSPEFWKK
ncbi:hypothetical protein AB834_06165 [PVC group bacterium (ex Bugula neritina AB1)]|nr:hypothetical protein AB834_06165 [PVC group bacterium (ex Bugula neritina AB1)]